MQYCLWYYINNDAQLRSALTKKGTKFTSAQDRIGHHFLNYEKVSQGIIEHRIQGRTVEF